MPRSNTLKNRFNIDNSAPKIGILNVRKFSQDDSFIQLKEKIASDKNQQSRKRNKILTSFISLFGFLKSVCLFLLKPFFDLNKGIAAIFGFLFKSRY